MMLIKFSPKRLNLLVLIILSLTSVEIECRKTSKHQHKETNTIDDYATSSENLDIKPTIFQNSRLIPDNQNNFKNYEPNSEIERNQFFSRSSDLDSDKKTDEENLQSLDENVSLSGIFDFSGGPFEVLKRWRRIFESYSGFGKEANQQWRQVLGALENFDDILRSTIPQVDKFQCVERVMCEFSSSSQQQEPSSILGDLLGLGGGSNQGGIQTLQQQFLQDPAIQQQLAQFGGAGFQSPQGQVLQQFGQPQFQLAQPQTQFARPQVFQSPTQFGRPQVVQSQLQFGQQQFASPQTGFFREGSNVLRRNEPTHETQPQEVQRVSHYQPPANYRPHPSVQQQIPQNPYVPRRRVMVRRKPQKNWFQRLFNLRRKKRDTQTQSDENLRQRRSLFDAFLGGWTNTRLFGILDQMAERYSFYPYTHAAYMGMTGGSDSCQTLYPECPSTPEEMINVVNNLHRHYPNGFPFKESIPWPFNLFLP